MGGRSRGTKLFPGEFVQHGQGVNRILTHDLSLLFVRAIGIRGKPLN
jgi:hypothetical protein